MLKQDEQPVIYVFFGLIATGKSSLAIAWAKRLALAYYNSDLLRKKLAGPDSAGADQPFKEGIYSAAFTRKTYNCLLAKAAAELSHGRSVVLDASFCGRQDRESVRDLAKKYGAKARFVLCSCPESELKKRMQKRKLDPDAVSDGRWEIYLRQKEVFVKPAELEPLELTAINTMAALPEQLLDRLAKAFF